MNKIQRNNLNLQNKIEIPLKKHINQTFTKKNRYKSKLKRKQLKLMMKN